ncbi:MAG: tetratricopeptide repeat protein [Tepidisphaera sp.]|nr:tetratricopeptide repeat protein [Tepidisphaera sp.]
MSQWGPRHAQVAALLEQGKVDAARAQAQRLAQGSPRDGWAAHLLSRASLMAGQIPQAQHFAARAAELIPGNPGLLVELAQLCQAMRKNEQAMAALREAVRADPEFGPAFVGLAAALSEARRFEEAERMCREWLTRHPGDAGAQSLLAGVLLNTARGHEAAALVRGLSEANPASPQLASGAALLSNYDELATPDEVWRVHRRYGEVMGALGDARTGGTPVLPAGAGKRLRVGLVSPDLRQHSVASFVEPLLKGRNRATMEIVVYQTNAIADEVTARLRGLADVWRVMDRVNDEQLAAAIRADGLDVCVELSGHTQAHSLAAMNARPSPLMVTWLGYPNTTGLTTIDARLVDSNTDPAGEADARASERLVRMDPCFVCFEPPTGAPEAGAPPSAASGVVTFGSFNAAQKLNPRVIALWARVLAAAPGSRLLLKAVNFEDEGLRRRVAAMFGAGGVDASRLELRGPVAGTSGHLAAYQEVDVALDPVPYAGTTTTCEALWMGVPVVTLAGNMHAGRVGVTLLRGVGLEALVARDEGEYVRLAAGLAADVGRRAELRRDLRRRMREGVLCDGAGFAARFEQALRGLARLG